MLDLPPCIIARHQLEDAWRCKLEKSFERYQAAAAQLKGLLRAQRSGQAPAPDGLLVQARRRESEALEEYRRMLQIFADLTIDGRIPPEHFESLAREDRNG